MIFILSCLFGVAVYVGVIKYVIPHAKDSAGFQITSQQESNPPRSWSRLGYLIKEDKELGAWVEKINLHAAYWRGIACRRQDELDVYALELAECHKTIAFLADKLERVR